MTFPSLDDTEDVLTQRLIGPSIRPSSTEIKRAPRKRKKSIKIRKQLFEKKPQKKPYARCKS